MSVAPENSERQRQRLAALKAVLGPVMGGAIEEVITVADFELSEEAARPFVEFVHWINTRPQFIASWRSNPVSEIREYPRFMTVTDGARSAYAGACYHLGRLTEVESAVNSVLSRYDFSNQLPLNSVAAIGRMRQLDFEYHAFVLAYRRCLDYLAWGLSTYFNQRQNSYRRFGQKTLASAHPSAVATALKAVYERHTSKFTFVMGDERGKALRDRISHNEFVQAAVINVRADGYRFVGGGENLRLSDPNDDRPLSQILTGRATDLFICIVDYLITFRTAVTDFEAANGQAV